MTEHELYRVLLECVGFDPDNLEPEDIDRNWQIVRLLHHRITYEGVPEDKALDLGCAWIQEKTPWSDWVVDHRFSEHATLGNSWVRAFSTKYPENFVRKCMEAHCELLDALVELYPLPHHADKVSRVSSWLDNATKEKWITPQERTEIRQLLVQHFF